MGHTCYLPPAIPCVHPSLLFHLLTRYSNRKRLGLGRMFDKRQICIISTQRVSYERNWRVTQGLLHHYKFFFSCFIFFVNKFHFSLFPGFLSQFISQALIHVVFYRIAQSHVTSFLWHVGMWAEDERRGYHGMKMMFILASRSALRAETDYMFRLHAGNPWVYIHTYMKQSVFTSSTNMGGNWNYSMVILKQTKCLSVSMVSLLVRKSLSENFKQKFGDLCNARYHTGLEMNTRKLAKCEWFW